ncbi:two-component system response regulator [Spirochaeta dissipatitropha]
MLRQISSIGSSHQARLLIVEDEKIIALDLQRRLQKYGYDIIGIAQNGSEAISFAGETQPDLILMDIMLHGEIDGVQAATQIHKDLQIPIIFLTAYADQKTLERAKEAEPFGYVLKPFKERELYSTIDIALYKSGVDKTLRQHDRWLKALLNNIGDGIIAADTNGVIDYMNPVAERICNWHFEEDSNTKLHEILDLHDAQTRLQVSIPDVGNLSRNEPMFFDNLLLISASGAHIHIEGSFAGIYDDNDICEGIVVAFQDVSTIKTMSDTIMYQASHDSLTGLINRDEFFSQLKHVVHRNTGAQPDHLLYLDIDQFKLVNDLCGHLAGDELLRQISKDIYRLLPSDYALARLGGDEFGILAKACSPDELMEFCEQLINAIKRKFAWKENTIQISVSIGVVTINEHLKDPYTILAAADDATYLAKESGGNTYRFYHTADFSFLKRRGEMQWAARITRALEEDLFILYEQPIVCLKDRKILKHEILLRLQERDDEIISPQVFIPAAERYNLMPAIDRWVIEHTFRYIRETSSQDKYAINLSGASIADPDISRYILDKINEYGINAEQITLEITETTAIENLSMAIQFIGSMRELGVSFALDDFGSGFSSFTYLRNLPVQYLKLDGSYVKDLLEDPVSRQMVESINGIGHVLGMQTIAEYVRSEELLEALTLIGVDHGQGYEIQRPAPLTSKESIGMR